MVKSHTNTRKEATKWPTYGHKVAESGHKVVDLSGIEEITAVSRVKCAQNGDNLTSHVRAVKLFQYNCMR